MNNKMNTRYSPYCEKNLWEMEKEKDQILFILCCMPSSLLTRGRDEPGVCLHLEKWQTFMRARAKPKKLGPGYVSLALLLASRKNVKGNLEGPPFLDYLSSRKSQNLQTGPPSSNPSYNQASSTLRCHI